MSTSVWGALSVCAPAAAEDCATHVWGKTVAEAGRTDMAPKEKVPPRGAGGRFVKRRGTSPSTTRPAVGADTRRGGIGQIAVLSLAIAVGVVGFAFSVFWIGALILMGVLWGTMAMERQGRPGEGKGLLAEVVEVVVDEAKDVAESARHSASDKRPNENTALRRGATSQRSE
jgi:hypothetical protein